LKNTDKQIPQWSRNFWTIALVLDFMSPKSAPIINQQFNPIQRVVLYPIRASDPNSVVSQCNHVIEKFMPTEDLVPYSKEFKKEPKEDRPLSATIDKIRFDIMFKLHPINEVVINVPEGDSCNADLCESLNKLSDSLEEAHRKIHFIALNDLKCKLPKDSAITVDNMWNKSAEEIVIFVKSLAMMNTMEAEMANGVSGIGTFIINGPPVQLSFAPKDKPKDKPFIVRAPIAVKMPAGTYKVTLLTPSWVKEVPGLEVQLRPNEIKKMELRKNFDDQLSWVESSKTEDLLLVFEDAQMARRILIPRGGAAVPVPKSYDWKLYPVPKGSSF
jgi:hypothetical protein